MERSNSSIIYTRSRIWDCDTHLPSKASSRLHIIRICKYYGYSNENWDLLSQSSILSVLTYAIEV